MIYDYSKLSGRIVEKFGTKSKFASAMKLSERTMSLKMNNKNSWKQSEIATACELLGIADREIPTYFFNQKVQQLEP